MRNDTVNMVVEVKDGRTWMPCEYNLAWEAEWAEDYETRDRIHQSLAQDLIAKKINQCTYIKSIKRVNLYTGFQRITVTYDNGTRRIYTVEN